MQEVAWASNALSGLEDIASVQDEALDAAALARAQKKDMEKLERREAETYGFDGVGAWDPVRGALIRVVRGVVLELGREFITELIGEVAHSMNDECDKARSFIEDALQGLVDGSDLRTLERARSELLMRNMNNERAVPTRAARRLASIEPTLLFLPGLDGMVPRPLLKMDSGMPPRPRLLQLGEPISTVCCSRGVTVTDDESSTVFIAVGGRRGGVAIGSVAHRPNPVCGRGRSEVSRASKIQYHYSWVLGIGSDDASVLLMGRSVWGGSTSRRLCRSSNYRERRASTSTHCNHDVA